jgi:hypothetical protein
MATFNWDQPILNGGTVVLIDHETAQNKAGYIQNNGKGEYACFLIEWQKGTNISAGDVVIEASHDPAYTGAWANLATVNYTADTNHMNIVNLTGTFPVLRARISNAVTGGFVKVSYTQSGD